MTHEEIQNAVTALRAEILATCETRWPGYFESIAVSFRPNGNVNLFAYQKTDDAELAFGCGPSIPEAMSDLYEDAHRTIKVQPDLELILGLK